MVTLKIRSRSRGQGHQILVDYLSILVAVSLQIVINPITRSGDMKHISKGHTYISANTDADAVRARYKTHSFRSPLFSGKMNRIITSFPFLIQTLVENT